MKKSLVSYATSTLLLTATLGMVGCGSDDSSSSSSTPPASGTSVTVVDPYIQDAVMYVDENNNGRFDDGEQKSTPSGPKGVCVFDPELSPGVTIKMFSKGIHNGVPFNGDLTADFTGTGIVSPLTTLLNKYDGNTTKVISLLTYAGITGITADDLTSDPMSGLDNTSTDADLAKLQASVAVNTFLEVVGTSSTEADIEAAKATLANVVPIIKNTINPTNTAGDFDAGINSAIAIANYAVARVESGDNSVLANLANPANVAAIQTALVAQYASNPEDNFSLDPAVAVTALDADSIGEAKSLTAKQFFEYNGGKFSAEWSPTQPYNLNAKWMDYDNFLINGTTFTAGYTGFEWDWDDENNNGIRDEHLTEWEEIEGSVSTSGSETTFTFNGQGLDYNSGSYSATGIYKRTIDGNIEVESDSTTKNGVTEISANRNIFISSELVTTVAGIPVGSDDRDVYKVKTKSQYGQIDGDEFVASGDGYEEDGWNCGYTEWTEDIVTDIHSPAMKSDNEHLVAKANGEVFDTDSNKTLPNAYWEITTTTTANDTLKVRAYDDYDIKIVNGECIDNWIGDLEYRFVGVTKEEAQAIVTKLDNLIHANPRYTNEPAEGLVIH